MRKHEGKYEYIRFDHRRDSFKEYINYLEEKNISINDWMDNYSSYIGHMSLSRIIGLYELYKKVLGVAGHIGEIGVYKGASFFLFAKLIQVFESESLTQVHGFDWFQGTGTDDIALKVEQGTYSYSYEEFVELKKMQGLDNIAFIHRLDVVKELDVFLKENLHLQFKLFFLDAGLHNIVKTTLPLIWERITPGGIVILDQYNHELAPGETLAVREILPHQKIYTLPNIWMPTAYMIKE